MLITFRKSRRNTFGKKVTQQEAPKLVPLLRLGGAPIALRRCANRQSGHTCVSMCIDCDLDEITVQTQAQVAVRSDFCIVRPLRLLQNNCYSGPWQGPWSCRGPDLASAKQLAVPSGWHPSYGLAVTTEEQLRSRSLWSAKEGGQPKRKNSFVRLMLPPRLFRI